MSRPWDAFPFVSSRINRNTKQKYTTVFLYIYVYNNIYMSIFNYMTVASDENDEWALTLNWINSLALSMISDVSGNKYLSCCSSVSEAERNSDLLFIFRCWVARKIEILAAVSISCYYVNSILFHFVCWTENRRF